MNRDTCVIQLRILQENAAVTTQLSCTYQLSPFGKDNLHFLKAKYLQLFQSVPPEFFPLTYGFSWSCNTGLWWSLQLSPSLDVRCQHSQQHRLWDMDWHQYFSLKPNFKAKHTWLHTKDLVEVSDTSWKGTDVSTEITWKSQKDRLHSPSVVFEGQCVYLGY